MREIKFRGKRIDNSEWVYGYYVLDPKGNIRIYWKPFQDASSNTYHFVIPESVGQLTGLKDKTRTPEFPDGKEIYEGDILGFQYPVKNKWSDNEDEFLLLTVLISFSGGAFWFTGDGHTDCNWHFYNAENREIIGNIYENPELIPK